MGCKGSKEGAIKSDDDQDLSHDQTTPPVQVHAVHSTGKTTSTPLVLQVPKQTHAIAAAHINTPSRKVLDSILGKPFEDIKQGYTLGKELGRGQYGITYVCTENSTGKLYACKSILKRTLRTKNDKDDIRREIQIMQHLSGQPNVVEFEGAHEDQQSVHLVMELCAGGELFDRIIRKKCYSEKDAAKVCREIMNVVHACHFYGVIHRDLKPENFLLSSKDDDATLKATDFGLSLFFEEGQAYKDIAGSAYYVAPEVLQRSYGKEIDIWSAGVILYILLSGVPPFWAETDKGIFDAIRKGEIDFQSSPWPSISENAKDLVMKMLTQDPRKRATCEQVLAHSWLQGDNDITSDRQIDSAVLSRMKHFSHLNKLKKLALKVIAEGLSEDEAKGLKTMFENIDADKNGTITYDELRRSLIALGSKISEDELMQLVAAADADQNGTIDYVEFVSVVMSKFRFASDDNLYKAFAYFDKDGSGYITKDELQNVLLDNNIDDINKILSEADMDNDGNINYNEFCAMMRGGAQEQGRELGISQAN